jgi:hypothetical protein
VNTQSDPTASAVDFKTDMIFSTDGGNGDLVQQNQYDGRGFRIVTRSYSNGTLAETRHAYFTDNWQCLEERLGDPRKSFE